MTCLFCEIEKKIAMPLESVFDNLATLVISVASDNSICVKNNTTTECLKMTKSLTNKQNEVESKSNTDEESTAKCHSKKLGIVQTFLNGRYLAKKRWKNANHLKINASERERKGRLATNIKKLKDVIPISSQKMQTKESVLEEALNYISSLKEKIETMLQKDSSEIIVAEMKALKKKVSDLENERSLYLKVLQTHGLLPMLNSKMVSNRQLPIPRVHKAQLSTSTSMRKSGTSQTSTCISANNDASAKNMINVQRNFTTLSSTNHDSFSSTATSMTNCVKAKTSNAHLTSSSSPISSCHSSSSIFSTKTNVTEFVFPSANTLYPQSSKAFCSLTYSLARMNGKVTPDIPKLPCVAAVRLCQNERHDCAEEKGLKKPSPVTALQESSPLILSSTQEKVGSSSCETNLKNSIGPKLTSVADLGDVPTPSSMNEHDSSGAVSSGSSSGLTFTLSSSTSVESLQTLLESLNSSKSKTTSDYPSSHSCASLASTPERHLMSWLRSEESCDPPTLNQTIIPKPSLDGGQTTVDNQPVVSIQFTRKSSSHGSPLHEAKSQASKKETNSFNIASLMKSKHAATARHSPLPSNSMSSLLSHQTNFSKEPSMLQLSVDHRDFNAGTPKDAFQNSFENEILDCLQNIPSLSTPEPPVRQSSSKTDVFHINSSFTATTEYNYLDTTNPGRLGVSGMKKQKGQNVSLDFSGIQSESLHRTQSRAAVYDKRATTQDQHSMDQPYPDPTSHCVETSLATVRNDPSSEIKEKQPFVFGKHHFLHQSSTPNVNYIPNNASVSLWQPAITSTPPSHQIITTLPTIPDCFSPMAYQYLNTNAPRLSHAVCSGQQASPNYKATSSWISHSAPTARYAAITSTKPPDQASETNKEKQDALKKRKTTRAVQQQHAKRKKSHSKPVPLSIRQNSHSIPQLMGYQHSTKLPQHSQVFMTHAGTLLHSTRNSGSCANNPNFSSHEKAPIFGSVTNNVMGPSGVGFTPDYSGQPNLFHSPPAVSLQTPSYHTPHGGYPFTYNHPVGHQQPAKHMYMPQFANTNNNNNASPLIVDKQPKSSQSQHHIRQILS